MNEFKNTLQRSLRLASASKLPEAIALLKEGPAAAILRRDRSYVILFSRNAGLLLDRAGQLSEARDHYLISLKHNRSDPYTCLALGDVYERMGMPSSARRYFNLCRELATKNGDQDLVDILALKRVTAGSRESNSKPRRRAKLQLKNVGDVIATRTLRFKRGKRARNIVTVRIGRPQPFPESPDDYFAPYQIIGIGSEKVRYAKGIDAVQALQLVMRVIGAELAALNRDSGGAISWDAGQNQQDFGFPT
jgi:hypothetical protein